MPHLSVEYSKSLNQQVNFSELLKKVHCALENCPGVDMSRVKSRLVEHEKILNGKNATEIQMIHVTLAVLSGRDTATKKIYGQALFNSLKESVTQEIRNTAALTVEIRDMDKDCYFR